MSLFLTNILMLSCRVGLNFPQLRKKKKNLNPTVQTQSSNSILNSLPPPELRLSLSHELGLKECLSVLQTWAPTTAATMTCRRCSHTKAAPAHRVTTWDGSRGKKVGRRWAPRTCRCMRWSEHDVSYPLLCLLLDEWFKFDDDKVSVVSPEDILRLSGGGDWHIAYVLLYGPRRLELLEE